MEEIETEEKEETQITNEGSMQERGTNGTDVEEGETMREPEETQMEERENNREMEVAPALIAVHPFDKSVAVAVGSDLRVFDLARKISISLADDSRDLLHKDCIRAVRFSGRGQLFVSAGDDKLVKIWDADTWKCLATVNSEKRVSAVSISKNELFVCFADKFGVVWAVSLDGLNKIQASCNKKAVPILAHYCSIITCLDFSPDGRFIISADRDFKIRVTVFPENPLNGAHEIQSFCLGHSEYVSSLAVVHNSDYPQGFLLSGGGDSTVRMWDINSGSLLCTCEVGTEVGLSNEPHAAVTDLCAPHGTLVAVAIQSFPGILLLGCDISAKALWVLKAVSFPGETLVPTSLGASSSAELLWTVTGVSNLPEFKASSCLSRVRVFSGFKKTDGTINSELSLLLDREVPGGEKLLEKLQGGVSSKEIEVISAAAADAVRAAMRDLLLKKQYTEERREFRKRRRNDRKLKR
ncbi:hypothetical protein Nepgr_029796 [Nepenthes gracilis]|uniref:tRNA (guanine-N(7)-)-methyltransferase non-catalytic subunit n=1 Tax=Nepenthes gracilis TaxID=150966 RepID=A0AAD3TF73_NEPGR|nr:hypothetical protein Nepgr_029796 [Nepenthes gracilis]